MSRMIDQPWQFGKYGHYSDEELQDLIDNAEGNSADCQASAEEYQCHADGLREVLAWIKQERNK